MGNPNRRPAVSSKSLEQKCLHRSGNLRGWTHNNLHTQQDYATWIQAPSKKPQAHNGENTVVQQQMFKIDKPQDWAFEVSTATQSGWEQDWDGDGWEKKAEEKGDASIREGESPLSFPAQSTVTLLVSLKEEAGNGEKQGPVDALVAESGVDLRQDGRAERDFDGGMGKVPEEDMSRDTAVSSWGGDIQGSIW